MKFYLSYKNVILWKENSANFLSWHRMHLLTWHKSLNLAVSLPMNIWNS